MSIVRAQMLQWAVHCREAGRASEREGERARKRERERVRESDFR
jgi:hypothetical protein